MQAKKLGAHSHSSVYVKLQKIKNGSIQTVHLATLHILSQYQTIWGGGGGGQEIVMTYLDNKRNTN